MLTGKQKKFLRGQAHHLNAILQVGKAGASEAVISQIDLALTAHELVKIAILQNCEQDRHEVADILTKETNADLVQVLGKTVVLYRASPNEQRIRLP